MSHSPDDAGLAQPGMLRASNERINMSSLFGTINMFSDKQLLKKWCKYWMRHAGLGKLGRLSMWLASLSGLKYKDALEIVYSNLHGFIAPSASYPKTGFLTGRFVFIDEQVTIHRSKTGGIISLGDQSAILRNSILEVDEKANISIGDGTWIHPGCKLIAAIADIRIGKGVMLASNCALYPHNHGIDPGTPIIQQPCYSKGPIIIGDNAWVGTGVIVLGGVEIGEGAVIGAGAVVTRDIPANAIAFGVPAKVVRMR